MIFTTCLPQASWKKRLFEGATEILQNKSGRSKRSSKEEKKISKLESKLKDRDEAIAMLLKENIEIKKKYRWGNMNGQWIEPDIRDSVVDFIEAIIPKTDIQLKKLLAMIGINSSKYYSWNQRKGKANPD